MDAPAAPSENTPSPCCQSLRHLGAQAGCVEPRLEGLARRKERTAVAPRHLPTLSAYEMSPVASGQPEFRELSTTDPLARAVSALFHTELAIACVP